MLLLSGEVLDGPFIHDSGCLPLDGQNRPVDCRPSDGRAWPGWSRCGKRDARL